MSRPLPRTAVVAAALAIISGGYLVIDAIHQFVVGDFLRIGGQLGPWAVLVGAVGIDPLSMGPVFLVIGVAQVAAATMSLLRRPWGDSLVLAFAVGTLWYLIFGTISSVKFNSFKLLPAMTRAASLANGIPMVLLTNGMVRDARGFTSST